MKLYEIDAEIQSLLDEANTIAAENDGEIPDALDERLSALEIERDKKIHNVISAYKNVDAEVSAVGAELKSHQRRIKTLKNQREWLRVYLDTFLRGEPYKDANHVISYRSSKSVKIPDTLKYDDVPETWYAVEKKWLKTEIKKHIDEAEKYGIKIEENRNIQIK